ncbi:MAG TPA: bidirectional hydrogenase complex protein HoxU [Capsulimonadaceae bacterium]|jgi:bidirectional [NiFe] hydrogenase diaphorase subunit
MGVKTLTINGKEVSAKDGQTVLDVARENGINIPTLCHMEGISDIGACRLCLVEVEGSPKLHASCVTQCNDGMVINVDTPKLQEYRRMILELLFAEGNHVCAVCVANGGCELQDLAVELGMDHVRWDYKFPKRGSDVTHKLYGMDHNRCVLCSRCIRVCDQIEGAHTIDMCGRGSKDMIIHGLNQAWGEAESCTSCGKCVQSCPTGALFRKGTTVAEMRKDRGKLEFLVTAREKKQWRL